MKKTFSVLHSLISKMRGRNKEILKKREKKLLTADRRHLPLPTGDFKMIGCRDLMTGSSKFTGVLVRIYYPAVNQSRDIRDHYLKWPNWVPHENYRAGLAEAAGVSKLWLQRLLFWSIGETFIPCIPNARPLRDGGRKWPVIVFSHGMKGCRTAYSTICTELASHGFIVAAIEHRDGSACTTFYAKEVRLSMYGSKANLTQSQSSLNDIDYRDSTLNIAAARSAQNKNLNKRIFLPQVTIDWEPFAVLNDGEKGSEYQTRNKQIHQRVRECSRTVDILEALNAGQEIQNLMDQLLAPGEFYELLDLDRIIIAGHSMGGATAIMALASELRFKLAICLDAWMYPIYKETFETITQPILFINTQTFQTKVNLLKMKDLLQLPETPPIDKSRRAYSFNDVNLFDNERKVLTIKGSNHYQQSDLTFILPRLLRWLFNASSRQDRFLASDLTTALMLEFIQQTLAVDLSDDVKKFLAVHRKELKEGIPKRL